MGKEKDEGVKRVQHKALPEALEMKQVTLIGVVFVEILIIYVDCTLRELREGF